MPIENLWASVNFALLFAIAGVIGLVIWSQTSSSKKDKKKMWGWLGIAFIGVALLGAFAVPSLTNPLTGITTPSGDGLTVSGSGTSVSTYQPTATYATQNKFDSTASVGGTSYYKVGGLTTGQPASTTAITNVEKGSSYTYWVDNGTTSATSYLIKPLTFSAGQVNTLVNVEAYANSTSPSISVYDLIGKVSAEKETSNISMGANDNAKVEFSYLGVAKNANLPFGGVVVIEYNNTIASVNCVGDGIVGANNKYQLTYTAASTGNNFKVYEVAEGYDVSPNGVTGVIKTVTCDFVNGATAAGAAAPYYIKYYAAGYYLGSDGNIHLDVEKAANGATTRTNANSVTDTLYWAA